MSSKERLPRLSWGVTKGLSRLLDSLWASRPPGLPSLRPTHRLVPQVSSSRPYEWSPALPKSPQPVSRGRGARKAEPSRGILSRFAAGQQSLRAVQGPQLWERRTSTSRVCRGPRGL